MRTDPRFLKRLARRCTTLATLALGLACAQRQGPAPAAGRQPAQTSPGRSSVAGTSQAPAPEVVAVPLDPCERVRQHNLAMLREASARVGSIMARLGGASLQSRIAAAEQEARTAGAVTRAGVRLDSLDDQHLTTLALRDGDARDYANASERVTRLTALGQALGAKQPIPITTQSSFDVELCKPDAQGAWAFWTVAVAYQPDDDGWSKWEVSRNVALARVSTDGGFTLATRFPSFLHSSSSNKDFPGLPSDNCCSESYGVGEPRLLFLNDQDSDGIPEIGLRAEFAVEGSHEVTSVLYRYQHGTIVEEEQPVESMTDVDRDGRLDIVAVDEVAAADQCGSGFPSHRNSLPYLGHALPDGTYSFDDATAREYLRQQCPARPKSYGDTQAIWCAKAWGVDDKTLRLAAKRYCAKDPCQGPSNLEACESLESAIAGFKPPLTLPAAGARPPH